MVFYRSSWKGRTARARSSDAASAATWISILVALDASAEADAEDRLRAIALDAFVAAGLAERCEVHLAYAIGQAAPLSLSVETFITGKTSERGAGQTPGRGLRFPSGSDRAALRFAPAAARGWCQRLLSAAGELRAFRARRRESPLGSG
jgi:hypothetical protein